MKRILGLTTAALLGASMFAAPGMAAGLDVDASGKAGIEAGASGADTTLDAQTDLDAGTNTTMPDVDTDTTAAIGATFDGALTAIDGAATTTQSISSITEIEDVRVVRVNELEGSDTAAVERAVSENQAQIDELRAAIDANAKLSQELQAEGVETSNVVAAQVEADGAVTVYVM